MTTYCRGEVVLVPFDFTDLSRHKLRPAVVVSSDQYNQTTPDILIASITSNQAAIPHPGDHKIRDWQVAGLLKPSLAQMKLATIETSVIRRKLGLLSARDLAALELGLRTALNLT